MNTFVELTTNELITIDGGSLFEAFGELVGHVVSKVIDVAQVVVKEVALEGIAILGQTAAMITGDVSIMYEADAFQARHSIFGSW